MERTAIGWKEWSGNGLNHLEILVLGEHCRVLIYLYKCKYWTEQNRDGSAIGIKINEERTTQQKALVLEQGTIKKN